MQTTQYRWAQGSPLRHVEFRALESGRLEAYIHAPEDAAAGQLTAVPSHLAEKGFSTTADEIDGRNLLRVTGFKGERHLLQALKEGGFVSGESEKRVSGEKERKPFAERLRGQAVKHSGLFATVGHAALAVAGVLEKDYKRVASSAFFGTATGITALYGAGSAGGQMHGIIGGMKDHLRKQGVDIPTGAQLTPEELAKKGGVVETLHHYVKSHPLEIGNSIGVLGNVALMASGLKNRDGVSMGRTANGLLAVIAGLSIILVPEKAKEAASDAAWPQGEREKEDKPLVKRFTDWVQERPIRFAGLLYLGGNAAMFHDAHAIQKKHSRTLAGYEKQLADLDALLGTDPDQATQADAVRRRDTLLGEQTKAKIAGKAGAFAYTTAAAYLVSTAFMLIASKEKAADYDEQESLAKLCAMSANLIATQPDALRDEAVDKMAQYLSEQESVKADRQTIAALIHDKADKMAGSPWLARAMLEQAAPQRDGASR